MNEENESDWSIVIQAKNRLFSLGFKELWRYKDLIRMFIYRDFVAFYKQTILGPIWYIIQPIITSGIFTVIFSRIAKISTDEVPPNLFYIAGVINWSYFADSSKSTADTFITNAPIFGKVYFPRLSVPFGKIITGMMKYLIQYMLFIVVLLTYYFRGAALEPSFLIFCTPLLLLQMAMLSFGFGTLVTSLTTKYRDLGYIFPFFVQLWFYATPVVYPLSLVPERFRVFVAINPMVPVVELFRKAYLGVGSVSFKEIVMSLSITILLMMSGIIMFNKMEKNFMDTV